MMAENRLRFAQRLNEMSDELSNLVKEVDKNRKQVCLFYLLIVEVYDLSSRPRTWPRDTSEPCKNQRELQKSVKIGWILPLKN